MSRSRETPPVVEAVTRTLHIVACSGRKHPELRTGPLRARLAYTGQAFLLARTWLESRGLKWMILSAKYGLLWPGDLVEWYDERMPATTSAEEWVGSLDAMQQKQYGRLMSFDRYICLGGAAYCHAAAMILDRPIERPLAGLGIGKILHALKQGSWQ